MPRSISLSPCPKSPTGLLLPALLLAGLCSAQAMAVVNPETTRLIFNAGERRIALSLANSAEKPALVQLWLDTGDVRSSPQEVTTPVAILPPMFRMTPGETRSVQMVLADTRALAGDKESLYWLNIYQVPPMDAGEQRASHKVVVPLRIRLKLFIRPDAVTEPAEDAGKQLAFSWQNTGSERQLRVTNPTPWHMTMTGLTCGLRQDTGPVMVAPKTTLTVPSQGQSCERISYGVIDDYGITRPFTAPVAL